MYLQCYFGIIASEVIKLYELIQVAKNTYYVSSPTRVGVFRYNDNDVCLIDSGYDTNAAKRIHKACDEMGFNIKMVFITHVHADHVGGCNYWQTKLGVPIYYNGSDISLINNTLLQASFVCGCYPFSEMQSKFFMAKPCSALPFTEACLPKGLSSFQINGHAASMTGFKTSDDVYFLADMFSDEEHIEKHGVIYNFDIDEYLKSLDFVETLKGKMFVMSHTEPCEDIAYLTKINRQMIFNMLDFIKDMATAPILFEDLMKNILDKFNITMSVTQFNLIGSAIRSFLSYLYNREEITSEVINNKLYWITAKGE